MKGRMLFSLGLMLLLLCCCYAALSRDAGYEAVGCYGDTSNRAIPTLEGKDSVLDGNYWSRENPIAKCAEAAKRAGYSTFAVQNGGWCAASVTAPQTFNKYGKSTACRADGEGGPWANQVYRFIDYETLGCYRDTANRAIQTLEGTDSVLDGYYWSRENPIAKCAVAAKKAGYSMFAVQNGGWCAASATAAQTFDKYGKSTACGENGEGGPWANQVYAIDKCHGQRFKLDECGRRCTCDSGTGNLKDCTRVRREFISMSREDRRLYINAVKNVSTDPRFKKEYEDFLQKHKTLFLTDIHQKIFFLPWHRWFVLEYENLLRKADCRVTASYWDWSVSNPFDTSDDGIWNDKDFGFGGNGAGESGCVPTGPFGESEWSILPHTDGETNHCLKRNFQITPNEKDVQDLLNISASDSDFTKYECRLRNCLHTTVHYGVGGTMFTFNSAAAPEFFLLHTMVDKIWHDWQKKGDEYENVYFPTVNQTMLGTPYKPEDLIDVSNLPGGVRVDYEESQVSHPTGLRLTLTQVLSLPQAVMDVIACNTCPP